MRVNHDMEMFSGVPDALWPTNNDLGVPLLDINMQADAFDQPWAIWGTVKRRTTMSGTWLFYTEDYRYEALWKNPAAVIETKCVTAVEPNFSCYDNMPYAVALWQVYRKRWMARYWQSQGIRIFADLNVAANYAEMNLIGIPLGWKAFATRGYQDRLDATHDEYTIACKIAGNNITPLFIVYGGGKIVRTECQNNGWLHVGETMTKRRENGKG